MKLFVLGFELCRINSNFKNHLVAVLPSEFRAGEISLRRIYSIVVVTDIQLLMLDVSSTSNSRGINLNFTLFQ